MPIDKTPWTAHTVIRWGAHRGKQMGDVPVEYLAWLNDQRWLKDYPGLHHFLKQPEQQARIAKARSEVQPSDAPVQQYQNFDDYLKDYRGI